MFNAEKYSDRPIQSIQTGKDQVFLVLAKQLVDENFINDTLMKCKVRGLNWQGNADWSKYGEILP